MASFNKFNCFVEDICHKKHNLSSDSMYVALTNSAPSATNTVLANITQVSGAGVGYTTGGNAASTTSSAQTSGTYKLVLADPATWTASGAGFTFRYAVLYNNTATNDELIGYWDYGSSQALAAGETLTVDFDPTNGVIQLA